MNEMTASGKFLQPPPIRNIVVGSSTTNTTTSSNSTNQNDNRRNIISGGTSTSTNNNNNPAVIIDTTFHRAVHKVRLSALEHNYSEVESVANRQQCSVIVVVKADGYGHGAIPTALYLADKIGADAFAVATLQEGIALRKAIQETAAAAAATTITTNNNNDNAINYYFNLNNKLNQTSAATVAATYNNNNDNITGSIKEQQQQDSSMSLITSTFSDFSAIYGTNTSGSGGGGGGGNNKKRRSLRQAHIRILVLGPPVGFPRCFDDYYHYNIEVMISGPEVAMALYEWVCNTDERKRLQVERAANDLKEKILLNNEHEFPLLNNNNVNNININNNNNNNRGSVVIKTKAQQQQQDGSSSTELSTTTNTNTNTSNSNNNDGGEKMQTTTNAITAAANMNTNNIDNYSRTSSSSTHSSGSNTAHQHNIPSATLTNVTGSDLAREVREIMKNQKLAVETQQKQQQMLQQQQQQQKNHQQQQQRKSSTVVVVSGSGGGGEQTSLSGSSSTVTPVSSSLDMTVCNGTGGRGSSDGNVQVFAGIEETARHSRIRQRAMSKVVFYDSGGDDDADDNEDEVGKEEEGIGYNDSHNNNNNNMDVDNNNNNNNNTQDQQRKQQQQFENVHNNKSEDGGDSLVTSSTSTTASMTTTTTTAVPIPTTSRRIPTNTNRKALPMMAPTKKRLRWHALVDSGMGRLGFRTDPVSKEDQGKRRDSVEILKELVDLEVNLDCPIEFYGMCTHMADASNSTSTYTNSQITKFTNLLKRVRNAGISVPTISTDNSAALLTTNLTHFDSKELLTQTDANSRGFVRTGGAIYGQRPTFPQLRAASTLMASVRHVAILKEGESVGYDRAYVAPMNSRIATLTIGFADGYPRELGNGIGRVSIRGHLFPVAGNVCMDMLMVELGPAGDKEGIGAQVVVGDTAILWGPDDGEEGEGHVRLQDLAAILKTTQSALTCGLNKERVLRQYS